MEYNKKKLFLMFMTLTVIMVVTSTKWLNMWVGMEMNLMMTIPFVFKNKSKETSEKIMIYFLTQVFASILFLIMILIANKMPELMNKMFMSMSMMIKLGVPPFHLWMPEMFNKMEWTTLMVMITLQKMSPLMVLSMLIEKNKIMGMIMIMTSTLGALSGVNNTSLNKILTFSSINHMSWMMMCMMNSNMLWIKYFLVYTIITITLCMMFNKYMLFYINQLNINTSLINKVMITLMMMNLGGLPPMPGFFIKWITLESMVISTYMYMISLLMIMCSMITLMFYMRMNFNSMMLSSMYQKYLKTQNSNFKAFMMILMNLLLPMMILI